MIARTFAEMRPIGGFKVILADPPWLFEHRSAKGEGKAPQQHYPCESVEDIAALPVDVLAADDCALFMWVTWPLMPQWMRVVEGWGFEFAGLAWEWLKFNPATGKYAFGPGYGTRKNVEPCLLCTRGNPSLRSPLPDDLFGLGAAPQGVHSVRDFIEAMPQDAIRAKRREHSRKPDEQYGRIETLFDGPFVELFARQARPGWSCWGNETDKFQHEEQVA